MAEEIEDADAMPSSTPDVRLLRSITLRNILSFGPDTPPLELRALNVLIGPNGSGKSNLLDALTLFQYAPTRIGEAVRQNGSSVGDWLWKGGSETVAHLELLLTNPNPKLTPLRHQLKFRETGYRFDLEAEWIDSTHRPPGVDIVLPYFVRTGQRGSLMQWNNQNTQIYHLDYGTEDPNQSILALRRDPVQYPQLNYLAQSYEQFRFYREWTFGRGAAARVANKPDAQNNYLLENGSNLALVLNKLWSYPNVKAQFLSALNELYEGITDFTVIFDAGTVQIILQEGKISVPATRLSDGTLRYLCLLAILLHPTPPPLICIEEPELGLHPDAIVAVGKLIKEASTRTQLIITTHAQILVDTFQESPEDVVVVSKEDGSTRFNRLDPDKLRPYLENYSLGNLWSSGDIGGNRW